MKECEDSFLDIVVKVGLVAFKPEKKPPNSNQKLANAEVISFIYHLQGLSPRSEMNALHLATTANPLHFMKMPFNIYLCLNP